MVIIIGQDWYEEFALPIFYIGSFIGSFGLMFSLVWDMVKWLSV